MFTTNAQRRNQTKPIMNAQITRIALNELLKERLDGVAGLTDRPQDGYWRAIRAIARRGDTPPPSTRAAA
jgi:hypothetical protein